MTAENGQPPKIGRPTDYTPEIAEIIATRLQNGETITKICSDKDMPDPTTFYRWFREHEEFNKVYRRAREERCYTYAEELVDLADSCPADHGAVAKARLQLDARKWVAVKYLPKVFGDRVEHEHTGAAIQVNILQKIGEAKEKIEVIEGQAADMIEDNKQNDR